MNTQIKKVKEEIERLQEGLMDAQGNFGCREHGGAYHVLCELESFINHLQEQDGIDYTKLDSMLDNTLAKETKDSWNERLDKSSILENNMQEGSPIPEIVDEHYWEMLGEEPVRMYKI